MKDVTQMTIHEMLSAMANVCLPATQADNALTSTNRQMMYMALMLEASRRDRAASETALTMLVRDEA